MIIINYYSTLIDKDYHCQHETHIFSYKNKSATKDFFSRALVNNIIHIHFPLAGHASLSHAERKER